MASAILAVLVAAAVQEPGDPDRVQPTLLDRVRPQEASGTAWQPAATPMAAFHFRDYGWNFMADASIFAGYDIQTGDRGEDAWYSTNWIMLMGWRPLGGGEITLRTMASVENWTVGERGYPLLGQTGEGLHDRQHPHDLFMELAAAWSAPLSPDLGVQVYAALVGDPALGPVAFPHRRSAAADPCAPLGHHWQDSTHISPGVLTAGLFTTFAKLEASWFNGREPDDNRLDLDLDVPDSVAARLWINPSPAWSMQVSAGRLDEPEEDEPGISVRRMTASTTATGRLASGAAWSATALWGRNDPSEGRATDAFLAEGIFEFTGEHTVFGRAEVARKTGRDLDLAPALAGDSFPIVSLSLGYVFDFARLQDQEIGLGLRFTVDLLDRDLEADYGHRIVYGLALFLRLRPFPISGHSPHK